MAEVLEVTTFKLAGLGCRVRNRQRRNKRVTSVMASLFFPNSLHHSRNVH
jgi:hypothetical protein